MDRQPVRQGALAEIVLKQEGLAGVEFPERVNDLVQLGLHLASDNTSAPSLQEANGSRECAPDDRLRDEAIQNHGMHSMDCFAAFAMTVSPLAP
jgi:hypothetical protein